MLSLKPRGPLGCALMSGEDEWGDAFRASSAPDLVAALAGCETEEILELLNGRRYARLESDEFEQIIRETDGATPPQFWSWPV